MGLCSVISSSARRATRTDLLSRSKDMVPVLLIPIHILDRLPLPLGVELAHLLN